MWKIFSFLMLLCSAGASGQTMYGMVVNGETAIPLPAANVMNVATQQSVQTDAQGNYTITASDGDILSYSLPGFHTIQRLAKPSKFAVTELFQISVKLQEYILRPDFTQFQKDSAELAELYSKELNTERVKPSFSSANGGGVSGLIGSAVQKMSKSYKKNKEFKETFKKDIEQRYIDTRYKPELVHSLTGLAGDSLALFMNTYPMEYDFARLGTELEIKMWIRDNYKIYTNQPLPQHPKSSNEQTDTLQKK